MIITINQRKVKEALAVTEKIVSKNLALPILQNVVIRTENGRVKISSTNLEIGINFWLGAKIEEEGDVAIPARLFSEFINNVQSEKVTISTKENIAYINTENSKTKIIGFPAKDFPIIPKNKNTPFVTLGAKKIWQLFSAVIDSASLSEARPELAGVFVHFSPTKIESAATDSFRLAEQVIYENGKIDQSMIIPKTTIQELIRALGDREEDIALSLSENQIFFSTSDFEIVSRLIDGHYPEYKRVIPEKFLSKYTLSREELEKSVRLASIFTSSIADIKLQADKDGFKVLAKNADKGEVNLSVPGTLKNGPFGIAVNYRYLLDGLKIIPTSQVEIEFTGEGSPLILHPEGKTDFTYLIMPLRS
ncbi:MAG: DNA polymerase III subunit beta [bacterium]|nr:DNA polymerase III subunit beta [bacterium]